MSTGCHCHEVYGDSMSMYGRGIHYADLVERESPMTSHYIHLLFRNFIKFAKLISKVIEISIQRTKDQRKRIFETFEKVQTKSTLAKNELGVTELDFF